MSRRPPHDVVARRLALVDLITGEGLGFDQITTRLKPRPSKRTLHDDIAWLTEQFPMHFQREKAVPAHEGSRVLYRWVGPAPLLLQRPIYWLAEEELIAFIAARGLLRQPDPTRPATFGPAAEVDPLAGAVDSLFSRAGVKEAADAIARDAIVVSRFGALAGDPVCLAIILAATVLGDGLHFDYDNLAGKRHVVHADPLRMALIKAEWYLLAWCGSMKVYRVARISNARRGKHPIGRPIHIPAHEIDSKLRDAFYATGSEHILDRKRVVLGVSPEGWHHVVGRRWGDRQVIEEDPVGLPNGWRRIHFTTTGLGECRHWVLANGTNMRAESPPELVDWLRIEAKAIASALPKSGRSPPR